MRDAIINLKRMNIINFKNVENGSIVYNKKNDMKTLKHVVGIYGQNGSGKTTIIDALFVFKYLVSGKKLLPEFCNLISVDKENASLEFEFLMTYKEHQYRIFYDVELEKIEDITDVETEISDEENDENSDIDKSFIKINKEKLSYSKLIEDKWTTKSDIFCYEYSLINIPFKPKKRYMIMLSIDKNNEINLKLQKEFSKRLCTSFIFRKECIDLFEKSLVSEPELIQIIKNLRYFAEWNLFVIKNDEFGIINTYDLMPFSFRIENKTGMSTGTIALKLFDISIIDNKQLDIFEQIIEQINTVIGTIIPSLNIGLKKYGIELLKNGSEGNRVELVSYRNGVEIPLKYESDGIKKIISILSALIAMYNNEKILLAVDELDAGVFEYLLGEILEVISEKGKGQFIFTSHNLRALEKLDKDSIVFTTTNPKNRYITLTNVKNTNNLRDFYLRGILLGGQSEEIYIGTNKSKISRAFRIAWRR